MNRIYRLVWSRVTKTWVAVSENARRRGKSGRGAVVGRKAIVAALSLACAPLAQAGQAGGGNQPVAAAHVGRTCIPPGCDTTGGSLQPMGGQVVSGTASITQSGDTTTIRQSSQDLVLNWQSFNIGSQDTVDFLQPSASAVAVNRILGTNDSQILGHLDANGQVWLINPNGVLFGQGAQVNVGGLVASVLGVSDLNLSSNAISFTGNGTGSVVNQGTINAATGGYVAFLANHVSNQGTITAKLGTVALGAGGTTTLTFSGNSLVKMQVNQSTLNNLAENGGLIQADGGTVVMSAGARNALLAIVVNNTGVIEARTVANHDGTIELLGGMTAGTVNVGGTLDASAPNGGDGGSVETSAAHVEVANDAKVTTLAPTGKTGTWLIDPTDFTVASSGGDMSGATLSSDLNSTNFAILSSNGASPVTGDALGQGGNININDTVSWSANTTLTLTASNNVNVNANIIAAGNSAGLVINPNTANGAQSASGSGAFNLALGNSITLSGTNPSLSIAGNAYTVINSLGAAGSTTAADLQGINGNLSGYYALGTSIDATATSSWNGGAGFTPIGNSAANFTGSFNGLGHTISNLTINLPTTNGVGLFGYAGSTAVIRNVGLIAGSVSGDGFVGELVGFNYGTVSNSYATGTVSGFNNVGGLLGVNDGTVSNSYATGSVTGSGVARNGLSFTPDTVGGLVGYNGGGTVSNSYATGSVTGAYNVGGLVGYNGGGTVSNSYATGSETSNYSRVGGLVGANYGTVSNSYWDTDTLASGVPGIGGGSTVGATGLTTAQLSGALPTGFDPTVWGNVNNQTTPYLLSNPGPVFIGNNYSQLFTVVLNLSQLQAINNNLAGDFALATSLNASGVSNWVPLGTDGAGNVTNSGQGFTGIFDGLGNTISNLTISLPSTNDVGLFGYAGSGAVIRNVGLIGASVAGAYNVGGLVGVNIGSINNSYATGSVGGSNYVGGLVGVNNGTVSTSYAAGSVGGPYYMGGLVGVNNGTVSASYAMESLNGVEYVGGLVGVNNGTVSNSYATGNLQGNYYFGGLVGLNSSTGTVSDSHATGGVSGPIEAYYLGGLAGYNYGTIRNSDATGTVSGGSNAGGLVGVNNGTVSASYAAGSVNGTTSVGGLVGLNSGTGTVSNSYATGSVSGASYVGGLVGFINSGGTISDSYATGSVSASGSNVGPLQTFEASVGGLVGVNNGSVSNSYATGSVSGGTDSYFIGGLVGINGGTVSNSYHTGSVSGTLGVTSDSYYVGGVVGLNNATVSNSFWNVSFTGGLPGTGGGPETGTAGLTTAQMQSASSFTGWSIATTGGSGDVWRIYEGNTFPLLISFLTPLTLTDAPDATVTYNSTTQSGASSAISGVLGAAATGTHAGFYNGYYSTQQGYDITGGDLIINPASLTLSGTRVYDGTTIVAGSVLTATGVAGQTFSVTGAGAQSNLTNKNVQTDGTLASVTGLTLGGSNNGGLSSDYEPLSTMGSSITITPLALIGTSIASAGSTYGSNVTPGGVSFSNVIAGDVVSSTASIVSPLYSTSGNLRAGSYAQMASGLGGAEAGDYSFSGYTTPTNNYTVTPLALTGTSIAASNSTYGSAVTPGAVSFSNVINGDVLSGSAAILNPLYSTSHHLAAGSYEQELTAISGPDAGNYVLPSLIVITPTNNYTVTPLTLTGTSIAASNSTYGSAVTPGAVSFSNVINGDVLSGSAAILNPLYSTSHHLAAGSYEQVLTAISGPDAGNYALPSLIVITPTNNYSVAQLALPVTGLAASNIVYNGSTTDSLAGTASIAPISGDVVNLSGTGSGSFASANVGTAIPVTVSGYTLKGKDADDYLLVEPTGLTASIAQLASVAWVGGTTGNWSKASNWAGGALPDYANVAAVTIPSGDTVTYDSGVPGATTLITLTSSGNLTMAAGSLSTTGNLSTEGYKQTGGTLNVGGSLTAASTSAVTLGNITAGSLRVSSTGGTITQTSGTVLDVTGTSSLTAYNSSGPTYYNITLGQPGNIFGGAVTATGANVTLADSGAGGLMLGATTANGTLILASTDGSITQVGTTAGTAVNATGATSLTASNGSGTNYDIILANTSNSFGGTVTATGQNINLFDDASTGLKMGNTTATGTLTLDAPLGAITQAAGTAINATGATTLTAGNGTSTYYGITLANANNNFVGAVSATGANVSLADSGASGLTVGNTTATGTLTLDSTAGPITQVSTSTIDVTGTTSLTADNGVTGTGDVKYNINLSNPGYYPADIFTGAVSANGANVTLASSSNSDGLILGNITATGTLQFDTLGGPITQTSGSTINVAGSTSLQAYWAEANYYCYFGSCEFEGYTYNYYPITLTNKGNSFVGAVTVPDAGTVSLLDSAASGLTINYTGGALTLGNTTAAGPLTVSSPYGSITQASGTTISAAGATSLYAYDCSITCTYYPITIPNTGNNFVGAVSIPDALNVSLMDSGSSGLALGYTDAFGTLALTSTKGPITQVAGTNIFAEGASRLTASNGSGTNYSITLNQPYNYFGGAVTSTGLNVNLSDDASTGLNLGTTTATGTLTLASTGGPITQTGAISATGASSLTADNGSGAYYNITLGNTANVFKGAVSASGANITLFDDASGGLSLGNTTAEGALTLDSQDGAISQSGAIDVTGATSLTASNGSGTNYNITLGELINSFGGTVTASGANVDLADSGASGLTLGNMTASGTLQLTSAAGPITQTGVISATGATSLTASNTASGSGTNYNITLANTSNSFGGTVTATGQNIDLVDDNSTGLKMGTTTATGTLTLWTLLGAITQSGAISATGTSSLTAASAADYNIALTNAGNSFGGAVAATGQNVNLTNASSSGLTLGAISAVGTLTLASTAGPITQSGVVSATGATSLTASNGSGTNFNITLANTSNSFGGAVTATGLNVNLFDDASTGLKMGATTATGTLTLDAPLGAITQSGAISATGSSSLTAGSGGTNYTVTLTNASNDFVGPVTAGGSAITLTDSTGLTAMLNSTGNASLTAAGAMNVSGAVTGNLTSDTTGTSSTTTFGNTAVGSAGGTSKLTVTSTGAVTTTIGDVLKVDGAGTTTSNPDVTVNGVKGAIIP
jgi:filamentous hemagglutinin family protein